MIRGLCALILFSLMTFHVSVIHADEALEASGLCHRIQNYINALADYTDTLCMPVLHPRGVAFVLLSKNPVFSSEESKEGWLMVTVGAVGQIMNAYDTIKGSDVYVSDMNLIKGRQAFKYPVDLAKNLQQQAKANQI